jgi:DNA-binding Lrp family transcriptional regulator
MGLEAEPGSQSKLYGILRARGIEAFPTLGGHDIVCKLPPFADLKGFRKIVDSTLFITEGDRAIVANTTTYIILDELRKETQEKPSAFCFIRSGKLPSREYFDRTVQSLYDLASVQSVSVTIGFFDIICEVRSQTIADLRLIVDQILSIQGVSSRAIMVCMISGTE